MVRLEYQADEQGGCVGEDELRRMVADQLGHDPFRPDADQRVAIRIAKTEVGFQGRIVWTEADGRPLGQRLLSSRSHDCHEIAANVAFAVALQLQLVERGASNDAGAAPDAGRTPPKTTGQIDRAPVTSENPSPSAEGPARSGQRSPARLALAVGAGPGGGDGHDARDDGVRAPVRRRAPPPIVRRNRRRRGAPGDPAGCRTAPAWS